MQLEVTARYSYTTQNSGYVFLLLISLVTIATAQPLLSGLTGAITQLLTQLQGQGFPGGIVKVSGNQLLCLPILNDQADCYVLNKTPFSPNIPSGTVINVQGNQLICAPILNGVAKCIIQNGANSSPASSPASPVESPLSPATSPPSPAASPSSPASSPYSPAVSQYSHASSPRSPASSPQQNQNSPQSPYISDYSSPPLPHFHQKALGDLTSGLLPQLNDILTNILSGQDPSILGPSLLQVLQGLTNIQIQGIAGLLQQLLANNGNSNGQLINIEGNQVLCIGILNGIFKCCLTNGNFPDYTCGPISPSPVSPLTSPESPIESMSHLTYQSPSSPLSPSSPYTTVNHYPGGNPAYYKAWVGSKLRKLRL